MMKSVFEEKTFSSFKFASLANWEGAKYVGGCWPPCLNYQSNIYENHNFSNILFLVMYSSQMILL